MKIVIDLFPSHVVVVAPDTYETLTDLKSQPVPKGAGYVSTARVVVTDEVIFVAQDSPEGAKIVFQERYEDKPTIVDGEYWLTTKSGKQLSFQKDKNCGCGSRLKSWNPYRTVSSIKDI